MENVHSTTARVSAAVVTAAMGKALRAIDADQPFYVSAQVEICIGLIKVVKQETVYFGPFSSYCPAKEHLRILAQAVRWMNGYKLLPEDEDRERECYILLGGSYHQASFSLVHGTEKIGPCSEIPGQLLMRPAVTVSYLVERKNRTARYATLMRQMGNLLGVSLTYIPKQMANA